MWVPPRPRQKRVITGNVDLRCGCDPADSLPSPGTGFALGVIEGLVSRLRNHSCLATTDRGNDRDPANGCEA